MLCPVFRRALLARARLLSHTCLLSSAAVIHLMQPAVADDTDPPKIEEIIVTAERREQAVQDVGVSTRRGDHQRRTFDQHGRRPSSPCGSTG